MVSKAVNTLAMVMNRKKLPAAAMCMDSFVPRIELAIKGVKLPTHSLPTCAWVQLVHAVGCCASSTSVIVSA